MTNLALERAIRAVDAARGAASHGLWAALRRQPRIAPALRREPTRQAKVRRLCALLLASSLLGGCFWNYQPPPPPPDRAQAEQVIRSLAGSEFTVESFTPGAGRAVRLENGQHYRYWLWEQPFEARLRFTANVAVRSLPELAVRQREPGWTIAESERDLQRLQLLGPGMHDAGSKRLTSACVIFERYGVTWRFVTVDQRLPFQ